MTKTSKQELISASEEIVAAAEADKRETVSLPTGLARELLELAKKSGRPPLSRSARIRESAFIAGERIRKKELIESGVTKETAHEQAAEELAAKFVKLTSRRLAVSTIKRKMQRLPRR